MCHNPLPAEVLINMQVAIAELRLTRALERVESLKNVAKWSYRQPKRQKNLGGLTKTHWDYLMDEMACSPCYLKDV